MSDRDAQQLLSIVVPAYNEAENVMPLYERLCKVMAALALDWELIFSIDPCTDGTEELIRGLCADSPRVRMIRMSRRFGQQMATIAGLEASAGDAVVVIDCDMQDPPEAIAEMVQRWREGYHVVYARRRSRPGESPAHLFISFIAYRVINRIADVEIPVDTGDFRLMSRRVVDNVVALKESHGYLRGLVSLVGFSHTSVLYDRDPRTAGSSKYNQLWGTWHIGFSGVVGFSRYPLQLISLLGVVLSMFAFLLAICYFALKVAGTNFPLGNPTIVIVVSLFSGIQMLSLGVIGEYIGRIYDESRNRPKYIVESRCGWGAENGEAAGKGGVVAANPPAGARASWGR
jgi:glycosyltransferase involved in cell wall biosynthesis